MDGTVVWQRVEGAVVCLAGVVLAVHAEAGLPWWLAALVFFVPDLSIIAYLFGPRVGAMAYNLVHTYGFGAALLAIGLSGAGAGVAALGALWLAHAGFDRMLGYGLKSTRDFTVTHLGTIGRQGGKGAP